MTEKPCNRVEAVGEVKNLSSTGGKGADVSLATLMKFGKKGSVKGKQVEPFFTNGQKNSKKINPTPNHTKHYNPHPKQTQPPPSREGRQSVGGASSEDLTQGFSKR